MTSPPWLSDYLIAHAVDLDLAEALGVRAAETVDDLPEPFRPRVVDHPRYLPAVLFPYWSVDPLVDEPSWQVRPLATPWHSTEPERKYDQLRGVTLPLNVPPTRRDQVWQADAPLVVVEGTKQTLAAASWLPELFGVLGIFGCYGWRAKGAQHPDWRSIPLEGRVVKLIFDVDLSTNRHVWDAAYGLRQLLAFEGVRSADVVALPIGGKSGLDDFLARIAPERRSDVLVRTLEGARSTLPRAPKRAQGAAEGDEEEAEVVEVGDEFADVPDEEIAGLLDDSVELIERFVLVPELGRLDVIALWIAHTHLFEVGLPYSPRLVILSAEPSSGKTLLLDCVRRLSHAPDFRTIAPTPPVIFRQGGEGLTMCLDEADRLFQGSPEDHAQLLAVVNSGYEPGAVVQRVSEDRSKIEVFPTYFPMAITGIDRGKFDPAMLSRSVVVLMERTTPAEWRSLERPHWHLIGSEFALLRRRWDAWRSRHFRELEPRWIELPRLTGRDASVLGVLGAIADLAGEGWPERFLEGIGVRFDDETAKGYGATLLAEIRRAFDEGGVDFVPTAELIRSLSTSEELDEPPGSPRALKRSLRSYRTPAGKRIEPKAHREGGWNGPQRRGYFRSDFVSAWSRYVDGDPSEPDASSLSVEVPESARERTDPPREGLSVTVTDSDPQRGPEPALATSEPSLSVGEMKALSEVAFDLETGDAEALFTWGEEVDFIRLASVVVDDAEPVVVTVSELMELLDEATAIYGHNALGFDLLALAVHADADFEALAAKTTDSLIVARLEDPLPGGASYTKANERRNDAGWLGEKLLAIGNSKAILDRLKRAHGAYHLIPVDDPSFRHYAEVDARIAWGLSRHRWSFGQPVELSDYAEREHRLATLAGSMSLRGVRIDVDLLDVRLRQTAERLSAIRAELGVLGVPLTTKNGDRASAKPWATEGGKEAIAALLAERGITLPKTRTGKPELKAANLVDYSHAGEPLVDLLVEALETRSLPEQIHENLVGDRVHPSISLGQASGRWSFRRPGLTTLGKRSEALRRDRALIIAEEGEVLLSVDLSQIDARAVAAHCQDAAYRAIFDEGRDLHDEVAERVLGSLERRSTAKAINHASNYGIGAATLAATAGIDEDEARVFLADFRRAYPDLVAWQESVRADAEAGRLLDNGFGRRLRCDPDRTYTQAPALVGQSAARDLICQGMLALSADVAAMLRLQVHDEVVLSVPLDRLDEVAREVTEALSFEWAPPGLRPVPIVADRPEVGANFEAMTRLPIPTEEVARHASQ